MMYMWFEGWGSARCRDAQIRTMPLGDLRDPREQKWGLTPLFAVKLSHVGGPASKLYQQLFVSKLNIGYGANHVSSISVRGVSSPL